VAARPPGPPPDGLLDLPPGGAEGDAEAVQCRRGGATVLAQEAEQDVLGADVGVVEPPGLLLGEDHDPARIVAHPLEHAPMLA